MQVHAVEDKDCVEQRKSKSDREYNELKFMQTDITFSSTSRATIQEFCNY